jgi:hypothetical protein
VEVDFLMTFFQFNVNHFATDMNSILSHDELVTTTTTTTTKPVSPKQVGVG